MITDAAVQKLLLHGADLRAKMVQSTQLSVLGLVQVAVDHDLFANKTEALAVQH